MKNHWPRRAIALLCIDGTVDRGREQCADKDSDHRPKPPISCKGILAGRRALNSSFCLRDNCRAQELEIDEIASCRGQAAPPLAPRHKRWPNGPTRTRYSIIAAQNSTETMLKKTSSASLDRLAIFQPPK